MYGNCESDHKRLAIDERHLLLLVKIVCYEMCYSSEQVNKFFPHRPYNAEKYLTQAAQVGSRDRRVMVACCLLSPYESAH